MQYAKLLKDIGSHSHLFLRCLKGYISGIDMNPPSGNNFAKVVFKVLVF